MSAWQHNLVTGICDDPVVGVLTCCCPCITYGQVAEKVHGSDCVKSGAEYCLSSCCICLCGTIAGPTRYAVRQKYGLPSDNLGADDQSQFVNSDCLLASIPYVGACALCQVANEIKSRDLKETLAPAPVPWWGKLGENKGATQTTAPAQETMDKPAA